MKETDSIHDRESFLEALAENAPSIFTKDVIAGIRTHPRKRERSNLTQWEKVKFGVWEQDEDSWEQEKFALR